MKHILEFFHDIIPIVFVVGIIAVAFIFYNHTKNLATAGVEKAYTFDAQLQNADILVYDQMTVSGADVVSFVRDFYKSSSTSGTFDIIISNVNAGSKITSSDVSAIVSNAAKYTCSVKSDSGRVSCVTFLKK
ncbi:MAG: hypothetical protein ACERKN_03290 [Velocimicrobium sp.]